jgi:HemY protein
MKRLFIAVLLTLLLAAALAAAIQYDAGYILIAFAGYTLETTVWVGLALMLLILVAMYFLAALLHRGLRGSGVFGRWRTGRRQRRSQQQTTRGMIALIEGQFERARHSFERAAEFAEQPFTSYLLASRASAAQGDIEQAQRYLERAAGDGGDSAVLLSQAELQLQAQRPEQALATLDQLNTGARRQPAALRLLHRAQLELGAWERLRQLLPELRRQPILSADQLTALELRVAGELLREAAAAGDPPAAAALRACWQQLPKAVTQDSRLVVRYARQLMAAGAEVDAERILRDQLKREWSAELIDLYGRVAGADPSKQLLFAEQWLPDHPADASLLRCLGRLSLRNQLWGKARDYLESSLALADDPETCAELGRLLTHLGQRERGSAYFERGLLASVHGLPALPLPEPSRSA